MNIDRTIALVPALGYLVAMPEGYDPAGITAEDMAHDSSLRTARRELEILRDATVAAWDQCVSTAAIDGGEKREEQASDARDDARAHWNDALRALDDGDVKAAVDSLGQARSLAAEWGEDSEERKALAMLEGL